MLYIQFTNKKGKRKLNIFKIMKHEMKGSGSTSDPPSPTCQVASDLVIGQPQWDTLPPSPVIRDTALSSVYIHHLYHIAHIQTFYCPTTICILY